MPKYKCTKCKKKFDCRSALERHYQRKTPCDQEDQFTCFRCKKVFNVKLNYERHINKKIPCPDNTRSESSTSSDKIALQREKIKLKEKLAENEIEKLRLKTEQIRLKTEQKEKDRLAEIEKLKIKNETKEKDRQKEIEVQKLKNEKVQLQKEKNVEVENKKAERKERTATIINKDNATININNITNNINNIYTYDCKIDEEAIEKFKRRVLESINKYHAINTINRMGGITDMIIYCIAYNFNNDNYPKLKYLKYDQDNKIYFKYDTDAFKPVEFEDIEQELRIAFEKMCKKILELAPEPKHFDDANFHNYAEIRNCTYKGTYSMKNVAGIGLLEENKIRDEEEELKPEYWN